MVFLFKLEKIFRFKYYHTVLKVVFEGLKFFQLNASVMQWRIEQAVFHKVLKVHKSQRFNSLASTILSRF